MCDVADAVYVPRRIKKRMPPMGGKIWCLKEKGVFVLEEGPTVFRTLAVTHVGSGGLTFYDGVPDEQGRFPGYDPDDADSNGTEIHVHPGTVLGSWMLDGGCWHGLTVRATGGTEGVSSVGSIVWLPVKTRARAAVPPGTHDAIGEPAPGAFVPAAGPLATARAHPQTGQPIIDVYRSAAPGSLMRSAALTDVGLYRLARRDAEFYSCTVTHQGTYGLVRVLNGFDETLWTQLSAFTGSFVLGGGADGALLVELYAGLRAPKATVNWREATLDVV
jgi:hypothetical protein